MGPKTRRRRRTRLRLFCISPISLPPSSSPHILRDSAIITTRSTRSHGSAAAATPHLTRTFKATGTIVTSRSDLERTMPLTSPCIWPMHSAPPSPCSEVDRDSLPPAHKRVRLAPAPFRQGYTPGLKPKASDYEDGVERTLLKAMHEYSCLILTSDAFPNEGKQRQWAKATWSTACEEVGEYYECSERMIQLVSLTAPLSHRGAECRCG